MAMFVTKILESNVFIERVYVDTFCHLAKEGTFNSEGLVRIRTMMELIPAETMKENLVRVLQACRGREDMKTYIKKELEIWARQAFPDDSELSSLIRKS